MNFRWGLWRVHGCHSQKFLSWELLNSSCSIEKGFASRICDSIQLNHYIYSIRKVLDLAINKIAVWIWASLFCIYNILLQSQGTDHNTFTWPHRAVERIQWDGRWENVFKNLVINLLSNTIVGSDRTQKSVLWTCPSLQWTSLVSESPISLAVPTCNNNSHRKCAESLLN